MWEISVSNQIITFALSVCLGALSCLIYDILRAMRKTGFDSFVAVFITDILFWLFLAFVTFIFLISRTNGEIRGYVLIGELIGFIILRFTVSKLWFKILYSVFMLFVKLKLFLRGKTILIYSKIERFILLKGKQLLTVIKNVLKSVKKLLKNRPKLLYTSVNIKSAENGLYETKTKT